MKLCSKCKVEKDYSEFSKLKSGKNGLHPKCKQCVNSYYQENKQRMKSLNKKNYEQNREVLIKKILKRQSSLKDGLYHVYILPTEKYAGMTDNPTVRKAGHKSSGRYVEDMRVLFSSSNSNKASELEDFLHDLGYKGHTGKGWYKEGILKK